jgi:hypothetical protein
MTAVLPRQMRAPRERRRSVSYGFSGNIVVPEATVPTVAQRYGGSEVARRSYFGKMGNTLSGDTSKILGSKSTGPCHGPFCTFHSSCVRPCSSTSNASS